MADITVNVTGQSLITSRTVTNYLKYSQDLSSNQWYSTFLDWSYNTITAPDGTLTASAATLNTYNNDSGFYQFNTLPQTAIGCTQSIFLKGFGSSVGKKNNFTNLWWKSY